MQINTSFDDSDLADLYDNEGATAAATEAGIADADKADWLRVNYLEPLIDAYLLDKLGMARQNKAYDAAVAQTKIDQDALATKIEQAQQDRKDALDAGAAQDTTPTGIVN
jgi:hypothetical protein